MIKLLEGDCLALFGTVEESSVDLVLCDPPYGTTACKWDSVIDLDAMWEGIRRVLAPGGCVVLHASQPFTTSLIASNYKMFKYCWVWDKVKSSTGLHAKIMPLRSTEDIVVFAKGKTKYNPQMVPKKHRKDVKNATNGEAFGGAKVKRQHDNKGLGYPKNLLTLSNANQRNRVHPTQKPTALAEYMIRTYSDPGDTVLDFSMGSGTTGVASVNESRSFIGFELDSGYFEIAKSRILP